MTNQWATKHILSSIEARLSFPLPHEQPEQSLVVHGRSVTRRGDLWTYQEYFDEEVSVSKGYSAADALHHIALVCRQDQPNTLDRLRFALSGGLSYSQDPLWPD